MRVRSSTSTRCSSSTVRIRTWKTRPTKRRSCRNSWPAAKVRTFRLPKHLRRRDNRIRAPSALETACRWHGRSLSRPHHLRPRVGRESRSMLQLHPNPRTLEPHARRSRSLKDSLKAITSRTNKRLSIRLTCSISWEPRGSHWTTRIAMLVQLNSRWKIRRLLSPLKARWPSRSSPITAVYTACITSKRVSVMTRLSNGRRLPWASHAVPY